MIAKAHRVQNGSGFTLIELLIVIGIMLMLSTLAVAGIARTLRAAAVNNSVAAIRNVCSMAQNQALRGVNSSGAEYPGVLLANRNGRWAVALVSADASGANSVDWSDAQVGAEGLPAITQFAPNVIVWAGDSPASQSDEFVWFYEPGNGMVVAPNGSGFSSPGAMVGTSPPPLFSGSRLLVFGAKSNSLTVVAAPTATNPGLSLRSRDQRTKKAVEIQPTGSVNIYQFD